MVFTGERGYPKTSTTGLQPTSSSDMRWTEVVCGYLCEGTASDTWQQPLSCALQMVFWDGNLLAEVNGQCRPGLGRNDEQEGKLFLSIKCSIA